MKLEMDGEILNQCCNNKVSPSPPPSVTPLKEWMLYNPNAKIKLPKRTVATDLRVISRNKITNPFYKYIVFYVPKKEA